MKKGANRLDNIKYIRYLTLRDINSVRLRVIGYIYIRIDVHEKNYSKE